jgi:hypothetical protein
MSRQQQPPLRLTSRGETVVDCLKVVCILVTLASAWAILTMIGV